jgi:(2S)-methylsuccinyl-CoA dehydrogenase
MTEIKTGMQDSLLHLEAADALIRKSLTWIGQQCAGSKGMSNEKLDRHQMASFDLAWSAAESAAARFAAEYAGKVALSQSGDGDCLEARMARVFCAEALQNIHHRFSARPQSFGLNEADLAPLTASTLTRFCQSQLDAGHLETLGRAVIAMNGASGAYLLSHDAMMMQDSFRKLATHVVMPLAEEIHREDRIIPQEILDPLTEMGCFGLSIPERYGGLQSDDHEDNMGMIVVTEELSRGSLGAAGSLITRPEILSRALLKGGTEEQRQKWLPRVAMGDPLCAVAVTEPDAGSDVAAMRLKATKCNGGWILDGVKTWCTMAGKAGLLLVLARSNPERALGHKGLSMFLVEKDSYEGHDFEYRQAAGRPAERACDCHHRLSRHALVRGLLRPRLRAGRQPGRRSRRAKARASTVTMAGFAGGRIQTAARAIGVMQAAYEKAVSYAQERQTFGKPIGDYQLTRVKLARMATLLTISRQFTYAVGGADGPGPGPDGSEHGQAVHLPHGRVADA